MRTIEHDGAKGPTSPLLASDADGDAADGLARELLASADRSLVPGDAKARNWRGVRARLATDARRERRLWPAFATALALVGTAAVAAPLATRMLGARAARVDRGVQLASRAPEPSPVDVPAAATDHAIAPEPIAPARVSRPARAPEPKRARAAAEAAPAAAAPAAAEDAGLVIAAVKALRAEHAPARAAALAHGYLARHPDGPLAEEALATLALATAESDARAAAEWATEYARRYPRGSYRDALAPLLARRAP